MPSVEAYGHHIFVDFNKAFDFIDQRAIPIALSEYGASELLITNIMQFCIWTSAVVAMAHGNTEEFFSTSGVPLDDTLASFFIITLKCS